MEQPNEFDVIDHDINFDAQGRMNYHPDFHENHGKPFTDEEKEYIAKYYKTDGARKVSFALGRTEKAIMEKYSEMNRNGTLDYYRSLHHYV